MDADEARRRAAAILARAEFRPARPNPLRRVLDPVGRFLARFLSSLGGGSGAGSVVGWVLVVGVAAGLVVLVVRALRRRPAAAGAAAGDAPPTVVVRRAADEWRAEAAAHAAAGRWREALRCRYRAVVAELADRGVVDDGPATTTGRSRAQVAAGRPELGPAFAEATEAFDRVVYGGAPADAQAVARLDALDRRLEPR